MRPPASSRSSFLPERPSVAFVRTSVAESTASRVALPAHTTVSTIHAESLNKVAPLQSNNAVSVTMNKDISRFDQLKRTAGRMDESARCIT